MCNKIKLVLVESRHGRFHIMPNDTVIGQSLQNYGEYAEHEMMLLSHWIQSEDTVIDVGANIGIHSVFFSHQVGPNGKVLAFEPQPQIFYLLEKNIDENNCKNVTAFNVIVGEATEEIATMIPDYSRDGNFGAFSFRIDNLGRFLPMDNKKGKLKLPVIRLDELDIKNCNLLKVDSEGMEREIIAGAVKMIKKFRPILYLENNNRSSSPALIDQVNSLDYQAYWHVISYYRSDNFSKFIKNIFTAPFELNLFCIPKESDIEDFGLPVVAGSNQWIPDEIKNNVYDVDDLLLAAELYGR